MSKKDFRSAKDCWIKGWGFEIKLMFNYLLVIVIGLAVSGILMGGFEDFVPKNKVDKLTVVGLISFLIGWPIILIFLRRNICYFFEKQIDEHVERRKKYGIKLMGEEYIGQFRTPQDRKKERKDA